MIAEACGCLLRPDESLAVQFASTRYFNGSGLVDVIEEPAGLAHWLSAHVYGHKLSRPQLTEQDFERFREAREAVLALLDAAAEQARPPARALSFVNTRLREHGEPQVRWSAKSHAALDWAAPASAAEQVLGRILLSTLETITPPRVERLRACHAPRCVLYFTVAHPRQQWCSATCGNRARVARYAERHQA